MSARGFFVPAAEPGGEESAYRELADFAGREALPFGERIYSIEYVHDGTIWCATVGETLRGERTITRQRSGQRREVTERESDPAMVLAIFPGSPYLVVTDARPLTSKPSGWVNPFMAGVPRSVVRFLPT